jgi:C4-dicarboxylate transporter
MELHEALSQISEIRQQMARSEVFRGYRSMTVGFSGVLGLLAAVFCFAPADR